MESMRRAPCALPPALPWERVAVSDAMEWNELEALPLQEGRCAFSLHPYQILTLKLSR